MSIGSINFGPGDSWKIGPTITLRDEIAMRVFAAFAADTTWTREESAAEAYRWADELLKHRGEKA